MPMLKRLLKAKSQEYDVYTGTYHKSEIARFDNQVLDL